MLERGQQILHMIMHAARAQGDEGKALCKDCCKPIIVTVCNNTEVIHQLLSAVHSSTLEEQVNGRIHRFFFFLLVSPILLPPYHCAS